LSEKEPRFEELVDLLPVAVYETDEDGIVTYLNRRGFELTGCSPEDLQRKSTLATFVVPEDREKIRERFEKLLHGEGFSESEYTLLRKDGSTVPVLVQPTPVFRDGSVVGSRGVVVDVSAKMMAEYDLRASEKKYRELVESANSIILRMDAKGVVTFFNEFAQEFFGFSESEILGRNVVGTIVPETDTAGRDLAVMIADIGANPDRYVNNENENVRKNGDRVWIAWTNKPVTNEDDRVCEILCVGNDITDRKRAEEQRLTHIRFLENLERIDRAMRNTSDLEGMMSGALEVVLSIFQSDRAWLLFPCDPEAPSFRVPMERTRPEYPGALALNREIPLGPGEAANCRAALATEDPVAAGPGTGRPVAEETTQRFSVKSHLFMGLHPKVGPPWVFGIHQCAHERVWTEDEKGLFKEIGRRLTDALSSLLILRDLRDSELKNRTFIEVSSDAIFLETLEGLILECNSAACEMYGYSREELLGRSSIDLVDEETAKMFPEIIAEHSRMGGMFVIATGKRKDGSTLSVEVNTSVVEIGGEMLVVVYVRDITLRVEAEEERRALEIRIQHAQKLESLAVLAGGIAHDFNNLLLAILGNADMALTDLSPVSPARVSLQEIQKAAHRAADLCQQMLAYSGKGKYAIEALNLSEVIRKMAHILEVSVSKQAVLRYRLADNLPSIEGDVMQMRQVFMNLVINASEALGNEGGSISVTTGVMECDRAYLNEGPMGDDLPGGPYVFVEIADTGCGMDGETQAKLFDPFFTTKFTGRGLGMSAVLGIVRGHGGVIKIRSQLTKGTTVRVLFPVRIP
jgi:PAS domain S-box-containing protein